MVRIARLLYFFHVVPPVPRLMVATLAVITVALAALVAFRPARAPAALIPLLLLQMFAAASGFSVPARRGHYDLLLTSGEGRVRIAAAHWVMSILPGLASWVALAVTEQMATRGTGRAIVSSGSVAALLLVSTIPWALTVSLPRFAGAIGWLSVLSMAAVFLPADRILALGSTPGAGRSPVEAVLAILVYPPVLAAESVAGARGFIVLPAALIAAASMVHAFRWIDRTDIPLEAAQ